MNITDQTRKSCVVALKFTMAMSNNEHAKPLYEQALAELEGHEPPPASKPPRKRQKLSRSARKVYAREKRTGTPRWAIELAKD